MLAGGLFLLSGYIGVYNERLAIILGLITLACALAIFVSCRSCFSLFNRFGLKSIIGNRAYHTFYRYHWYYWWAFLFVFVLHAITGVMHSGLSSANDPDAFLHKYILWLGLAGFVAILVVIFSCRSLVSLADMFRDKPGLTNNGYRIFYGRHAFYWILFFLLTAAHFAVGYIHAGIWPQ
jgi:hypothetical protein